MAEWTVDTLAPMMVLNLAHRMAEVLVPSMAVNLVDYLADKTVAKTVD